MPGINAPKVQANTFGGDTHRKGTLWDVPGQGGIASAGDIQGKPGSVTLPLDDLFTIPETLTSRIHRRDEPSSRHAEKFEKLLNWVTRKSVGY